MGATARITWLLQMLALGVLLDRVFSEVDDNTVTSVYKYTSPFPSVITLASENDDQSGGKTKAVTPSATTAGGTEAGEKKEMTQPSTPANAPTMHPASTTLQLSVLTANTTTQLTPTTLINGAAGTAGSSIANTNSPSKDPSSATTAGNIGTLVEAPTDAATAAPTESGTSTLSAPDVVTSMGKTVTPSVSTIGPTLEHQSSTHSSIISNANQEDYKRDTVTAENHGLTTNSTGTTGFPVNIRGTTAGTTFLPTAPILTSTLDPSISTFSSSTSTLSPNTSTLTTTMTTTIIVSQPNKFLYSLNKKHEKEEEKDLVEVCRRLMANLNDGNCTLVWQQQNGKIHFDCVEINGKVKTRLAEEYYEEITKKPTDNKTLIAILASCGALLIMIVILAVCASHHRKPYGDNQQHLTEELHTVENGYHDNPTLEVMEVQPEMQEKKMALNREFSDSWIVPIDNLMKDDMPDEEDTHL